MADQALPCIVCSKSLKNIFDDVTNQPDDGLACTSHGHYGSTAWDPMDGQYIEFNICDECLVKRAREGYVLQGRDRKPVYSDDEGTLVLVGYEIVNRELVDWDGERGRDDQDRLIIEPEDVGDDNLTWTHEGRHRIIWLAGKRS